MSAEILIRNVLKFSGHLFLATYGVVLLVFGLGYALAAAFDPQGYAINYFFVSPSFAVPVVAGLLFGYRFGRRLSPVLSHLIPAPPLAFLLFALYSNHQSRLLWNQSRATTWATFFGTNCFGLDNYCYQQFGAQALVTAPLAAALAYVIGTAVRRRKRTASDASPALEYDRWKRRAYIGSAVVVLLTLSVLQRVAHPGNEVEFYWSAATGFRRASLSYPPAARYPLVSRWFKIVVAPLDQLIILQTKPHIVSTMKRIGWNKGTGCVIPDTLGPLPVVLEVDPSPDSISCMLIDPEVTALMKAAQRDDLAAVRQQIASGADVNARDQDGFPVLQYAIRIPASADVVRTLLSAGADVNARNTNSDSDTMLLEAVHSGADDAHAAEVVKVLIAAGADLNAKNSNGQTPLALAIEIHRFEIAQLLRSAGAAP